MVTHMFYTAWPDHGVPRNTMSLISFIRRVHKEHPTSLATPLLVHCSAGVGRTGTFILLDLTMQQMRSQGTLSVFQYLKNMRTQRMKMVQTLVSVQLYWYISMVLNLIEKCHVIDTGYCRIRNFVLQCPWCVQNKD